MQIKITSKNRLSIPRLAELKTFGSAHDGEMLGIIILFFYWSGN
jgi:hypothetical protein